MANNLPAGFVEGFVADADPSQPLAPGWIDRAFADPTPPATLYHFTAREYLDAIMAEGLTKGEVPMDPNVIFGAVWLTSSRAPSGHGLGRGKVLTVAEKRVMGVPDHANARMPNKEAIRIEVDTEGLTVVPWMPWARRYLDPSWMGTLHRAAAENGPKRHKTWFMVAHPIPVASFRAVVDLAAKATLYTRPSSDA